MSYYSMIHVTLELRDHFYFIRTGGQYRLIRIIKWLHFKNLLKLLIQLLISPVEFCWCWQIWWLRIKSSPRDGIWVLTIREFYLSIKIFPSQAIKSSYTIHVLYLNSNRTNPCVYYYGVWKDRRRFPLKKNLNFYLYERNV